MPKKTIKEVIELKPSTLENIDWAFFDWVDREMNISCQTNEGFKKVPVVFASPERVFQSKTNITPRDAEGTLVLPLISVERVSVEKDPLKKGAFWGNVPAQDQKGGSIVLNRRINTNKTPKFRNEEQFRRRGQLNFVTSKNQQRSIVYETLTIPMPVYVTVTFTIAIKANFQQQMNQILQPFLVKTGGINYFIFGKNGHPYEGFFPKEIKLDNSISAMENEERLFKTSFDVETLCYIYGTDKNIETPRVVISENIAEYKFGRERVIIGGDDALDSSSSGVKKTTRAVSEEV